MIRKTLYALLLLLLTGCIPPLPVNVDAVGEHKRSLVRKVGDAAFFAEETLAVGSWLEIARTREPGVTGGYYYPSDAQRPALLVCLPGASSFYDGGMVAKTRDYHDNRLTPYHDAGLATWTLAVRECGTPYAGDDLNDVRETLDWLEREGRETLGVERVFLVGYSSGAILASLADTEFNLDAVVSISGVTQSDSFERFFDFYRFVASLYPNNAGLCQLADTLRAYGPPGSPAWDALDVVGRVDQFRNPTLVIHGARDPVYPVENARALQAAFDALPPDRRPALEIVIRPRGGHIGGFEAPDVTARVLAFLESFLP